MENTTPIPDTICYTTISWGELIFDHPHCGVTKDPTVIVALWGSNPTESCQEPLATEVRILPIPAALAEAATEEEETATWTSDEHIDAEADIVWEARIALYLRAQEMGYETTIEKWEGLDDIDEIPLDEILEEAADLAFDDDEAGPTVH